MRKEAGKITDQEKLEHLITKYQNLIFTICYKFTNNYFDAEDIAQDTFLAAYSHLSSFDGQNEKAWIARIATNKCIDYKRRNADRLIPTEKEYFDEILDESKNVENECSEKFVKEKLSACCKALKPPYDEVAMEYFYYENSFSEIAKKLDKNEKTIQTQVYRAKAMLKKLYERGG